MPANGEKGRRREELVPRRCGLPVPRPIFVTFVLRGDVMFRHSRRVAILGGFALALVVALWAVENSSAQISFPRYRQNPNIPPAAFPTRVGDYPALRPGF